MSTIYADGYSKIAAKTANYTLTLDDNGKVFTNRGATAAVTFTLPPTSSLPTGYSARFVAVADYDLAVASNGSADNIVAYNDATADSVTFSTATKIIGASLMVIWDGTGWLGIPGTWNTVANGASVTLATIA